MDAYKYLDLIIGHQVNITLASLVIIALVISGLFLYYTNDLKPTIISFLSVILAPVLTALTLFILYEYFEIEPSEKHTLILWMVLFVNVINLSTLIGKYSKEILKKDFDIDHVTRHHFSTTLNLFITILLITVTVSVFVDLNMIIIMISTLIISSTIIWANHLMSRFLLKDK